MGLLSLWAVLLLASPAPATTVGHGLSVRVPPGWHVLDRRLTPCTNPVERVDLVGNGALVMVQEALDHAYVDRFPVRPTHFRVHGAASWMACCTVRRRGWRVDFRDSGRSFYAYVYPGRRGSLREALTLLDSLRVAPSP